MDKTDAQCAVCKGSYPLATMEEVQQGEFICKGSWPSSTESHVQRCHAKREADKLEACDSCGGEFPRYTMYVHSKTGEHLCVDAERCNAHSTLQEVNDGVLKPHREGCQCTACEWFTPATPNLPHPWVS